MSEPKKEGGVILKEGLVVDPSATVILDAGSSGVVDVRGTVVGKGSRLVVMSNASPEAAREIIREALERTNVVRKMS